MKKTIIGLTGGIASGKTSAMKMFSEQGFFVMDADIVSREVIEEGTKGWKLLLECFPEAFETMHNAQCIMHNDYQIARADALGLSPKSNNNRESCIEHCALKKTLNRQKLREIVFNDKSKLKKLESITHPIIKEKIEQTILTSPKNHILLVVPLLFETGFNSLCDKTIAITSNEKTRIERVKKRDNINDDIIAKILSRQLRDDERASKADVVFTNNNTLCNLNQQVKKFIESLA